MAEAATAPTICAACGAANRVEAHFCTGCGDALRQPLQTCGGCGTQSSARAIFCRDCGLAFSGSGDTDLVLLAQSIVPGDLHDHKDDDESEQASLRTRLPGLQNQAKDFVRENPYIALAGVIVAVLLIAGIVRIVRSPAVPGSEAAQAGDMRPETLYAVRLAHIRNNSTSIGSSVIGDLQPGQAVSGTWVTGRDGTTKWLHIKREDGSDGYIWGRNLSPVPLPH